MSDVFFLNGSHIHVKEDVKTFVKNEAKYIECHRSADNGAVYINTSSIAYIVPC